MKGNVEDAESRYAYSSPENRGAAWLDLWHALDFTWQGRSEKAVLQTEMVEVPASFPDGRDDAEGEFKTVSLKDYWRWSVGLEGEERLLTDEEMREAGLLVEVEGETYHLIHAPDMALKVDEHGTPLQILTDAIAARVELVPEDIGTDADGNPSIARALQLQGGWLPGELLRHACAETAIDMSGAQVSEVNLDGLKLGPLNCFNSLFTGNAHFVSATFNGVANLGGATFIGNAHFASATFNEEANFGGAIFNGEANLGGATFIGNAHFASATFSGEVYFVSATFNGEADFESATFNGRRAAFDSATFSGEAGFVYATFNGMAVFSSAIFNGEADFGAATFSGQADFGGAIFSGRAGFRRAIFKDFLTFEDGTFEGVVLFRDVNWSETNSPNAFRGARFKDRADFKSSSVPSISSFNEAHFELEPSFTDPAQSQINEIFRKAIKQANASIKRAHGDKPKASRKEKKAIKDDLLYALEGGFRTLKKVAEDKGNFLLAQTYYRLEVKTRVRRPTIPFWEKVAAAFYGLSSDYGNSIARPFVSLAFILAGFAVIYLALAIQVDLVDWQDRQALQSGFLESLDFSLKNVFRPLSALSTDAPRDGDATSWAGKLLNNYGKGFGLIVTAISIIQSLTGIVLAFLFGLAVRRRFQIS